MKPANPIELAEIDEDNWISERWLSWIFEDRDLVKRHGSQIRRGRNLARKGVRDFELHNGLFKAEVTSDTGEIHSVTVRMDMIDGPTWAGVLDALSDSAIYVAEVLQGRLSEPVAEMFEEVSLGLFPFDAQDLKNYCSCSEEGLICMGVVAAHIHFAEIIQVAPLNLFQFRGRDRDRIVREIRERRRLSEPKAKSSARVKPAADVLFEDATAILSSYWSAGSMPAMHFDFDVAGSATGLSNALPVVRALDAVQPKSPSDDVAQILAPLVRAAVYRLELFLDRVDLEFEPEMDLNQAMALAEPSPEDAEADKPSDEDSLDEMIVNAAKKRGTLTTQFVANALGIPQKEARDYLQYLVSSGRLTVSGKGRGTRYIPA